MRSQFTNAVSGIAEYAAYPVGMLLVAPVVLHRLGAAQFGIWVFAMAAVNTGGVIASGFGDANIQHVATARGAGEGGAIEDAVRATAGIHLVLGLAIAALGWALAPVVATRVAGVDAAQFRMCLAALRIASLMMLVRAVETVAVSTQRAFERYSGTAAISIATRVAALAATADLAIAGRDVITILGASACIFLVGTCAQFLSLARLISLRRLRPGFRGGTLRSLLRFGAFSWGQTVAVVIFTQVDRLFLGVSEGAVAVGSYALCVQLAQPIAGVAAAALHFIFPHMARRSGGLNTSALRRMTCLTLIVNVALVMAMAVPLLLTGPWLLARWAGVAIANSAARVLPLVVLASAAVGLSTTGTYAMLALGRVRVVTWLSVANGGLMLLCMPWLLRCWGVDGIAAARLAYGLGSLLIYVPLLRHLAEQHRLDAPIAISMSSVEEGAL